jgi:capsular polysaccharide transport system permease protein
LNASLIVMVIFIIFWAFGIDFMPRDFVQASLALLAMMLLGLAFGIINGIIAAAFPFWVTGYALVMIITWAASGVLFVPDALPEVIRTPLSYLPMLQGVEWMRSAYYDGYGAAMLDKIYLIYFALVTLFVGLGLERLVRGKMLGG